MTRCLYMKASSPNVNTSNRKMCMSRSAKQVIISTLVLGIAFQTNNLYLSINYTEYLRALGTMADTIVNKRNSSGDSNNDIREASTSREIDDTGSSNTPFSQRHRHNGPIKTLDTSSMYDCGSKPLFDTFFPRPRTISHTQTEIKLLMILFSKSILLVTIYSRVHIWILTR